ncbi:MAG: magnesium transporter [Candidatus Poribacteria bacterium]|nr:magnesium transporter [Candidatus Poribacteria bacterium]
MSRATKRRSKKVGLPPGTLVYTGDREAESVKITVIDYNEDHFQEHEVKSVEECFEYKDKPTITWINIESIHRADIIESIGKCFGIHPLVLEDVMSTGQRPKMETYEGYVFIVLRMLRYSERKSEVEDEQLSLIAGQNFVISFQEAGFEGDVFDPIRVRIREGKGYIRKMKADYLAYVMIDIIVDNYFTIVEKIEDNSEQVEESVLANPSPGTLHEINLLKRKLIFIRKALWPLREAISILERGESEVFSANTILYLRDVHDHTVQLIDTIDSLREVVSDMTNVHLSNISNRLNEIMKVLTIISTIFMPLTFLAGIYGMNFVHMPELKWILGYPILLLIMISIGISMVIYFKRKKWF